MADSIFHKARTALLAKANDLLDRQVNTVSGYRQYIRDLEVATADTRKSLYEAQGTSTDFRNQITTLQSSSAQDQSDVDLLLGDDDPSNDDDALQLQMGLQEKQDQIAGLQGQLADNEEVVAKLNQAVNQLDQKHQQMVTELSKMTVATAAANAKDKAASALESASSAVNSVGGASVDNIEARLNHEASVADARFDAAVGGLGTTSDPAKAAALARAKAAIAARRAEITGQAAAQATSEAPAPAST